MTLNFGESKANPEKGRSSESPLRMAYNYSKERLEIALDSHTGLSDDTKQMVRESLKKASAHDFMSDALDNSLADRHDNRQDEGRAARWLANYIAQDVMPRFAQNNDHYDADAKQANTLLTFLRGTIISERL